MGKPKQHLPHDVSPDNDLFLAMFLIRLPPSMREVVGTWNHKTAVAMVRAADALWDARGGHGPTVAAAMTQHSRSPAPASGKKNNKRTGNAPSKSLISSLFKTRVMACASFIAFRATKHTSAVFPDPCRKTKALPNPYQLGGKFNTCHCHSNAFPSKRRLIFLTDELTNHRYLVDTGATLSIVPCMSNTGPLVKWADGQPIPSWGFVSKTIQFQGKLFTAKFLQAIVAGPILGIDFSRKFRITVGSETTQVLFACTQRRPKLPSKHLCPMFRQLLNQLFLTH
jgi:hypothetical protein